MSNMYGFARTLIDVDYRRMGASLVSPFDASHVQPASYDVTLGPKILRPRDEGGAGTVDLRKTRPSELMVEEVIGERYVLPAGCHALVSTREQVCCPPDMICSVDGKSTIGRCFVAIHVTAGFVDPGYVGAVTLELVNHGPWNFVLYEGMRIGQLRFTWLGVQSERPYGSPGLGSHYQHSLDVRAAERLQP